MKADFSNQQMLVLNSKTSSSNNGYNTYTVGAYLLH